MNLNPETIAATPVADGPALARTRNVRVNLADVTGFNTTTEEVSRDTTVSALARSMADRWSLPTDTPWTLRSDDGLPLEDDRPISEQLAGDELSLTLMPKAHLG